MNSMSFSHPHVAVVCDALSGRVRRVVAPGSGESTVADWADDEEVVLVQEGDAARALADASGDFVSAMQRRVSQLREA